VSLRNPKKQGMHFISGEKAFTVVFDLSVSPDVFEGRKYAIKEPEDFQGAAREVVWWKAKKNGV
jgi:hypothetical protein